jgi:AcrR family transcriptional regulator
VYGTGGRETGRDRRLASQAERRRAQGGRPAPRARGLSQADIVTAAVALADAEGREAVSIRRIARDLRVGPMSLYWHVSSTSELHQLMIDQVQAETEVPDPSGDWRADLRGYALSARAALLHHPWAIDFLGAGPPSGPRDARNADRMFGLLDGLGLDLQTTVWALMTVSTYVLGAALREIQEIRWHQAAAEAENGMTEEALDAVQQQLEQDVLGSGRYPHLARLLQRGFDPDAPGTRDQRFEFGLGCLLDGIAARLPGTAATDPR